MHIHTHTSHILHHNLQDHQLQGRARVVRAANAVTGAGSGVVASAGARVFASTTDIGARVTSAEAKDCAHTIGQGAMRRLVDFPTPENSPGMPRLRWQELV